MHSRGYYKIHPVERQRYRRMYYQQHRSEILLQAQKKNKGEGIALRMEMISAYGGKCTCCGEQEPIFLTIEHLFRDGRAHREQVGTGRGIYRDLRKRGWPKDRYTLLCFNCNMAKKDGRECPHQSKKMVVA
jgi:hypothetical protein